MRSLYPHNQRLARVCFWARAPAPTRRLWRVRSNVLPSLHVRRRGYSFGSCRGYASPSPSPPRELRLSGLASRVRYCAAERCKRALRHAPTSSLTYARPGADGHLLPWSAAHRSSHFKRAVIGKLLDGADRSRLWKRTSSVRRLHSPHFLEIEVVRAPCRPLSSGRSSTSNTISGTKAGSTPLTRRVSPEPRLAALRGRGSSCVRSRGCRSCTSDIFQISPPRRRAAVTRTPSGTKPGTVAQRRPRLPSLWPQRRRTQDMALLPMSRRGGRQGHPRKPVSVLEALSGPRDLTPFEYRWGTVSESGSNLWGDVPADISECRKLSFRPG